MDDQIEMVWKCKACGTFNGGLSKKCGERIYDNGVFRPPTKFEIDNKICGKHIEDEEWFWPEDISVNANLTDEEDLKKARAGADWVCHYCGSSRRRTDGKCEICGGDFDQAKDRAGESNKYEYQYHVPAETAEWNRGLREAAHRVRERESVSSDDDLDQFRASLAARRRRTTIGIIGAATVGAAILSVLLYFALRPRYVDAKVVSTDWSSTVQILRYEKSHGEGWTTPMGAVNVVDHGKRKTGRTRKVQDGTKTSTCHRKKACGTNPEKCSTTPRVCSSNKNGTGRCTGGKRVCTGGGTKYCNEPYPCQVPKYKDVPIEERWYSWDLWSWNPERTVSTSGRDLNPYPPDRAKYHLNEGCTGDEKEKAREPSWTFNTRFKDTEGENHTYHPRSAGEYKSLPVGSQRRLKITAVSVSIEPT